MLSEHRLCQLTNGKEGRQSGMGRKGNQAPGGLNKENSPQWYFVADLTYSIKPQLLKHSSLSVSRMFLKLCPEGQKRRHYKQRLGRFQKWGVSTSASCVSCHCALYIIHRKTFAPTATQLLLLFYFSIS